VSDTTPVTHRSHRYPSFLSSPVELVKNHAGKTGSGWWLVASGQLEIKGRGLDGFLLLAREANSFVRIFKS